MRGKSGHVQGSFHDISEGEKTDVVLHQLIGYEQLLNEALTMALLTDDLATFHDRCLALVGGRLNVDRAYFFKHNEATDTMDNTHEWCAEGVVPEKDKLQGIPEKDFTWWVESMKRNEIVCYPDIAEIPDEVTKNALGSQEIKSILVVPLFLNGQYDGFLGFDDCARRRDWKQEDIDILLSLSKIVSMVTGRKLVEAEKEKLQSQLLQAQKMESVGRLAGGVAHDFNNMLTGIMGYAELCRHDIDDGHPAHEWLDGILHESRRSADLTRQLLAFARKQTIAPQVLNFNDGVGNMLKMLRRLIGEGIDLIWQPGANLGAVKIDPGQIDQILANLCVNARDAIGGRSGKLILRTENILIDEIYCAKHIEASPGAYVMLEVSDNGCGMDKETALHIFEPFFTTKDVGVGTGLGLATVYGIVKQNAGFINVYSEPNKGTTFRIHLPRVPLKTHAKQHGSQTSESPIGTETILLVEDEKAIRFTLGLCLKGLGYTVHAAESPEEALRLIEEQENIIDLLLTDVVMPGMSGRELAEKLAPDYPAMKVLYMSGYTADVIASQGILEENVQFVSKPFSRDALARKVRGVLDEHKDCGEAALRQPIFIHQVN
ncbi:MAG: response regulator [Verrucomicrobia bacterium]|nr:response regulator [Verrucomicrobiota bacterium]MCH8511098.1 response regulator [Kiritimatiellia bacterium]